MSSVRINFEKTQATQEFQPSVRKKKALEYPSELRRTPKLVYKKMTNQTKNKGTLKRNLDPEIQEKDKKVKKEK